MSEALVAVALPLPLQTELSYRAASALPRGVRVLVPFGKRRVTGVAVGPGAPVEGTALRDVIEVLDEEPLVEAAALDLAAWVAAHYLAPPGECYRLVLPPAGVGASRAVARLSGPAPEGDALAEALAAGPLKVSTLARRLGRDPSAGLARLRRQGLVELEQQLARTPGFREVRIVERVAGGEARGKAQARVLERLDAAGGRAPLAELIAEQASLRSAVNRLAENGAVRLVEERSLRNPATLEGGATGPPPSATAEQASALERLLPAVRSGGFAPLLLHGVTASGKTEVYFRAIEEALAAGRGAMLLVPEIALTPLLVRAAVHRFGDTVSLLHSELSAGERHDQWWRIREGESRVVVGARSAVFAPVARLGLIVVDEEHEAAYKQEEAPRYHGRDTAVMRARLQGVPVVLGSATPSVESYANARRGRYTLVELTRRVGERALPQVEIVDRRADRRAGGDPILTHPLRAALEARLERREQSLLLLNRRGWATSLVCRECGTQAACPNCSVCLTVHGRGRTSECHYCGFRVRTPVACEVCRGEYLKLTGFGTEKVAEAVAEALPQARVARLDRDLAARRGAVAQVLAAFEAGQIDVLVGTQMIAKGHDFPRVTLVGVIDADVGLGLPDFRAAERTFHLLTQVAGRAGRGDVVGEVILQSHMPDHYALQLACRQDFAGFFERELEFRNTMAYPPRAALVNLVVRSRQAGEAIEAAGELARRLRAAAQGRFRVLGPAEAPLARLRQEHRFQVLLKGARAAMREAVREALVARFGALYWTGVSVDVDPVSVL